MVSLLTKLLIKDYKNVKDSKVRETYGILCGAVGIVLNILLSASKMIAGTVSGSIAIMADGLNNLSDAASSLITMIGFKVAGQKADSDHPFGHGRFEYISGFTVSIIILIMAFELLKSSVEKIISPSPIETNPLIIGILVVSICVKFYMFLYNKMISKKIDSAAMDATAKDSISDSVATTVVLFTTLLSYFADIQIDGYCGIVVALFVFWTGFGAARETISPLLGQPPEPEFVENVERIIMEYKPQGVMGIHDLVVHNYGPGRVMLSVHVEVPATGDIVVLHDMIDLIEHRLAKELSCSAVIHMDPVCADDDTSSKIRDQLTEIIHGMSGAITFHDFRIVAGPTHTNIIFDVVVPYQYPMTDAEVIQYLKDRLSETDERYFAVIDVDKSYSGK